MQLYQYKLWDGGKKLARILSDLNLGSRPNGGKDYAFKRHKDLQIKIICFTRNQGKVFV